MIVKLGDVAFENRENWTGSTEGVPIVGLEHLTPGEITLKEWTSDLKESTFTKKFRKGQVLLGRRRVYLRKAALAPFDGICSGDITVIESNPAKLLPELLPFIIQNDAFFDYAMKGSAGSLSPRVKWAHLANYTFNLPSLPKQKRLADLLWAANDLKESYKRLLAASDEMAKSRFVEMFGTNEKCHYAETVSRYANVFGGYAFKSKDFLHKGVSVIRIGDIDGDYVNIHNAICFQHDFWESNEAFRVLKGDLLMAMSGATTGKIGLVLFDQKALLNQRVACIRAKNPKWVYFLKTFFHMDWLTNAILEKSAGSAQPNISIKQIQELSAPAAKEEDIVVFSEFAEQLDKSKAALQKSITALDNTIKSLLHKSFSGEEEGNNV